MKPSSNLLNPSILKCFFKYDIDPNSKINNDSNDYFVYLFNKSAKKLGNIGGLEVFNVNGLDYIKASDFSGILVESMLKTTYELCSNIIDKVIESDILTSEKEELETLKNEIKQDFQNLE